MFTHGDITDVSNYIHYGDISIYNIVYSTRLFGIVSLFHKRPWAELYSKLHVDRTANLCPNYNLPVVGWILAVDMKWKDVWSILLIEKHPANQFIGSLTSVPVILGYYMYNM